MSTVGVFTPDFRTHLESRDGQLTVNGVLATKLAEEYGTPLYVLSEDRIRQNLRAFQRELASLYSRVLICPAYKANSHLAVARIYRSEGAGAEVVSAAELRTALDAGVPVERIVFNGPVKKNGDLELAISRDVGLINADSVSELDRMQGVAHRVGRRCNVGIRVNLGIAAGTHPHLATALREHKFGVWVDEAVDAYRHAVSKSELNVIGFHSHIGSNIIQPEIINGMTKAILQTVKRVNQTLGVKLSLIDLGGGLGFPYQPESRRMTFKEFASAAVADHIETLKQLGDPTLIFEPGRAIVADAGILLTRVETLKRQGSVEWAIVDAGMNTFLRPALYDAKHQVVAANRSSERMSVHYNVGGPCCESADVIAKDVALPALRRDDLLAVLDVGAYGYTMSSNYNGQPRPAVVLVSDGRSHIITRRESYEDMIAGESVPAHLAGD